jgi:hypothetical protein
MDTESQEQQNLLSVFFISSSEEKITATNILVRLIKFHSCVWYGTDSLMY